MKFNRPNRSVGLACAAALLITAIARADAPTPKSVTAAVQTPATTNTANSVKSDGLKGKVIVTGSNIPQDVKRVGRTTDSISPVLVIDRQDIQRSGATTVGDVLRRLPFASSGPGR
jgi:outer membrane cobalamin receptor